MLPPNHRALSPPPPTSTTPRPGQPQLTFQMQERLDIYIPLRAPSTTLRICVFSTSWREVSAAQSGCQRKLPRLKQSRPPPPKMLWHGPARKAHSSFPAPCRQITAQGTPVTTRAQQGFPGLPYLCLPLLLCPNMDFPLSWRFPRVSQPHPGNESCKIKLQLSPSEILSVSCVEDPFFQTKYQRP